MPKGEGYGNPGYKSNVHRENMGKGNRAVASGDYGKANVKGSGLKDRMPGGKSGSGMGASGNKKEYPGQ